MTPKQILDSFSDTLMQDERILSAQERALVVTLLQHAKTAASDDPKTQETVRAVIASAVGETVAQRAFSVLGSSIVERILEGSSLVSSDTIEHLSGPQTPGRAPKRPTEPQHPGHKPLTVPAGPETPSARPLTVPPGPETPGARPLTVPAGPETPGVKAPTKQPQSPVKPFTPMAPSPGPETPGHAVTTKVVSNTTVAVAERPQNLPAQCVVLDEFLAPQELEELTRFTLDHEADFQASEVVSPHSEGGVVNYDHRRSRVLMELGPQQDLLLERIGTVLPQVLDKLGMEDFSIADVEAQITASNDGDFFHFHSDNGNEKVAARHLTFVYFFHREPRSFEGGELRIHDSHLEEGAYVSEGSYQPIVPRQNQIVFFPCELMHEITAVKCPSQLFADSRFTVNGWLRQ